MKALKLSTVFFVILMVSACKGGITDDMARYGLSCKVKSMGVSASYGELDYIVDFNAKGMVEHISCLDPDGEMLHEEFHSFDRQGRLVEIKDLDGDGVTEGRYSYSYDGDFIAECTFFGMNNQEVHRWVHSNDGQHIVKTDYYSEGVYEYVTTKEFDGDLCHERSTSAEGELLGTAVIRYYAKDKPSSMESDDLHVTIEYNEKGLPVKTDGTMISSSGELGWQPDLEEFPVRYYKYEYDRKGNWVTRTEHRHPDSLAVVTVNRSIVY